MGEVTGFVCIDDKMLVGGTGVTCNDGTLTYTANDANDAKEPVCKGELS